MLGAFGFSALYVINSYPSPSVSNTLQNLQLHPASNSDDVSKVRVLCLILTAPKYFSTRTKAVHETWARRCDGHFFVTEPPANNLTVDQSDFVQQLSIAPISNMTPGYDHLTQKMNLAFKFAYEKYFNDFDWFVKADDDTYLIVDHLKLFLSDKNTSEPVTYGCNFKLFVPRGFPYGGASYVLSREALQRFYDAHNDPTSNCTADFGGEDIEIAKCLRGKGVYPGPSLDKQNREIFHALTFAEHFSGPNPKWLIEHSENPLRNGYDCCSDQTVSFHHVTPDEQYLMNFLLYRTRLAAGRGRLVMEKLNSSVESVH